VPECTVKSAGERSVNGWHGLGESYVTSGPDFARPSPPKVPNRQPRIKLHNGITRVRLKRINYHFQRHNFSQISDIPRGGLCTSQ
jgi:hypothetical protein